MTTLRDYILDCRCPNCGTSMQQRAPERKSWWSLVNRLVVVAAVTAATVRTFQGEYAQAALDMAFATFLVVTDK